MRHANASHIPQYGNIMGRGAAARGSLSAAPQSDSMIATAMNEMGIHVISSNEWWRDPRCHLGKLNKHSAIVAHRADIQPAIEFVRSQLMLPAGARILDLCCGPGRYAIEPARRGFAVLGLDVNEDYVSIARRLAEKEKAVLLILSQQTRLTMH